MRLALLSLVACLPLAASAQIRTSDAPRTASLGAARGYIADVGWSGAVLGGVAAAMPRLGDVRPVPTLPLLMRFLGLILLVLVTTLSASAQRARPWAEAGDVALVVGISGGSFADLTPALGGIGVRYRVTDRTVIGTSVGFDYAVADQDGDSGSSTQRGVQIALWNENHVGSGRGLVSPFVGAGATFGVRNFERDIEIRNCTPFGCPIEPAIESISATNLSFSVGALLGAEVRLARGVTLGAAYTLGVAVDRTTEDRSFDPNPFGDRTLVRVGTGVTDLNLSVYF